ncbi:MAG TPA: tripartite tricarboxylate transporter substrate binding protein [Burkholderiales bacterium]|nr:tripartite tricarboxylate transporter substrate binding protein [Burkholderiales bacterium]
MKTYCLGRAARKAATVIAVALASTGAVAQQWPVKPIRLVVPFVPGGGADYMGRIVSQQLSPMLGHTVVVDNRPGAAGTIGVDYALKAPPDGYTLLIVSTSYGVNPSLYKLPYDPVKDLQPVMELSRGPYIVSVHPSLPVKSVRELIALAKANPGALNYGSSGLGGNVHLTTELFSFKTGIKMTHIPYKGTGAALIDAVAGHTSVLFGSSTGTLAQVHAGKLRGLAVTSAQRLRVAPELPTVIESGVPGFDTFDWQGLVGPRGMPRPIVDRLNADLTKAFREKDVVERLQRDGLVPGSGTPETFGAFVAKEIELWRKVVTQAGVKLE